MADEIPEDEITEERDAEPAPTGRGRRILRWFSFGFALVLAGATFLAIHLVAGDGESEDEIAAEAKKERPLSAVEIITQEFAGKIELGHEPPPGASPSGPGMFVAQLPPDQLEEAEADAKREPASVMASAAKSIALHFSLNRKATKVSKGLDKKKVVKYLDEKLSKKVDCGSAKESEKSVKAVIQIGKAGRVNKIQVTPKENQKQIAQCLKKKLGPSATAFKTKGKSKAVAEITLELKLAR